MLTLWRSRCVLRVAHARAGGTVANATRVTPGAASVLRRPPALRPEASFSVGGSTTVKRHFSSFNVTFVSPDGSEETPAMAESGQTILDVAKAYDIDIEGACGGECSCSTCHIYLEQEAFDAIGEADEDELDLLDLANHVTDLSRLGCQITLQQGRDDGLRIFLPKSKSNLIG